MGRKSVTSDAQVPRLVLAEEAQQKILAIGLFYLEKDEAVAKRAMQTIVHAFKKLLVNPHIGRPYPEVLHLRELVIPFGAQGFVALYRIDANNDVVVLNIRHQREQNYPG